MPVSLSALIAQKDALDRQIRDAQNSAKADAIARIRMLMADHGLSLTDLPSKVQRNSKGASGKKVAPKYRDPKSGATWTGRGLKPKWLMSALATGSAIDDFAI